MDLAPCTGLLGSASPALPLFSICPSYIHYSNSGHYTSADLGERKQTASKTLMKQCARILSLTLLVIQAYNVHAKTALIVVDMQRDFMDDGPGTDSLRAAKGRAGFGVFPLFIAISLHVSTLCSTSKRGIQLGSFD